jgi:hypothetical protein
LSLFRKGKTSVWRSRIRRHQRLWEQQGIFTLDLEKLIIRNL